MAFESGLQVRALPLSADRQGGFRYALIVMGAVFCWIVGWYWSSATEIASIWWRSDTFAHGLVVWPIFVWLVWRKRCAIDTFTLQPSLPLCLLLVPVGMIWLMGVVSHVAAAVHFALVAMVVTGFMAALGWPLSRVILFPLLFLFFAVPVGEFLLPVLMSATAEFTVAALRLSGVPVYQEGLHFVVPNGRWSVVEACSGIRYLFASLMIGSLYAYLYYTQFYRRVAFMIVALCVPIVANWVRAYMIVMLGYLSNNKLATGVDHLVYGWLFFGVVIMLMFWIGGRWQEPESAVQSSVAVVSSGVPRKWVWGVIAIVIAAFPLGGRLLHRSSPDFEVVLMSPAPAQGWSYGIPGAAEFRPHYLGYRAFVQSTYFDAQGIPVNLYVAFYAAQRDGSEMITWGNGLVPPESQRAHVIDSGSVEVPVIGKVNRARVAVDTEYFEVRHWYSVDGAIVRPETEAKLLLAVDRLLGRNDTSAVVVVSTPLDEDDAGKTDRRLAAFLEAHGQAIDRMIDTAVVRAVP